MNYSTVARNVKDYLHCYKSAATIPPHAAQIPPRASMILRPVEVCGEVVRVPMPRGKFAVVDLADIDVVAGYNWFAKCDARAVYAMRKCRIDGRRSALLLHRAVMRAPPGVEVDHIDCDGLNNRRQNLRFATHAENTRNARLRATSKSGFKGVHWNKGMGRWVGQVTANGDQLYLGAFDTAEAANAVCVAERLRLHGEFARVA